MTFLIIKKQESTHNWRNSHLPVFAESFFAVMHDAWIVVGQVVIGNERRVVFPEVMLSSCY